MDIDLNIAKKVLETVDAGLVKGIGKPMPGAMCVEAAVCYAMGLPHSDEPSCVSRAIRSLKITLNDARWSSNEARAKGMRRLALVQLGSAGVVNDQEFAKRVAEFSIRVMVPFALRVAADLQKDTHHKGALMDAALLCEREGNAKAARSAESAAARSSAAAEAAWSAAAESAEAAESAAARSSAAAEAAWSEAAAAWSEAAWSEAARSSARSSAWSARLAARLAARSSAAACDKPLAIFAEGVVQILIQMKAPGVQWLYLTEE